MQPNVGDAYEAAVLEDHAARVRRANAKFHQVLRPGEPVARPGDGVRDRGERAPGRQREPAAQRR